MERKPPSGGSALGNLKATVRGHPRPLPRRSWMSQRGPMVRRDVAARVRALSLALPEATVRRHHDRRQFSEVRDRWFCILNDDGASAAMIVAVDPLEREMLLATGHPFFAGHLNANRI